MRKRKIILLVVVVIFFIQKPSATPLASVLTAALSYVFGLRMGSCVPLETMVRNKDAGLSAVTGAKEGLAAVGGMSTVALTLCACVGAGAGALTAEAAFFTVGFATSGLSVLSIAYYLDNETWE